MFHIQTHVAFEILRTLFEPKLAKLILSYKEDSIQLVSNWDLNKKSKTSSASELHMILNQFMSSIPNKIQAQMLSLIYYCGKKKRENGQCYDNHTHYLMASLAVHLDYNIPAPIMEANLFYVLENGRDVPRWEVVRKKLDERDEEEEGNPLIEERNELILGLLRRLEDKMREEDVETVRQMVQQTDL